MERSTAMRRTVVEPYHRRRLHRILAAAAAAALLALPACDKSNPVEPATGPSGGGGGGSSSGTYTVRISASPASLAAGTSGTLTLTVQRKSDAAAPADGSQVSLNTSLGWFSLNSAGKPVQSATLTLVDGAAQTPLFAGDELGTADVLAAFDDSTGSVSVPVTDPEVPAFFVSGVSPGVGSGQGGDTVTISGTGFTEPLRVTFGDAVADVTEVTDAAIVATTPAAVPALSSNESRRVDVAVTIDLDEEAPRTDSLSGGFVYSQGGGPFNQPAVFSLSPTQGPNSGGTEVTISGQGFEPNARVFFGFAQGSGFDGVPAKVVAAPGADGAFITVESPAASGAGQALLNQTVDVQVENPRTGLTAVKTAAFRYGIGSGGGLQVTDVSPRSAAYTGLGASGAPVAVTLLGQGFGSAGNSDLRVTLAGVGQGTPTVISDTELRFDLVAARLSGCSPPSGPAEVTNVVTGDSGASSATFAYTVEAPQLTGVSPISGPAAGGGTLTLSGSDLLGTGAASETVQVTVDGVRAAVGSMSATQVQATIPAFTGTFSEQDCDENGDGTAGKQFVAQAVDVVFTNAASGCSDTLARAFSYQPADTSCRESETPELVADFTFVASGLTVNFHNTSQGQPTEFFWDFGDGTTGIETTQEDPTHIYAMAATYTVTLFVEDADGQQAQVSKSVTVTE